MAVCRRPTAWGNSETVETSAHPRDDSKWKWDTYKISSEKVESDLLFSITDSTTKKSSKMHRKNTAKLFCPQSKILLCKNSVSKFVIYYKKCDSLSKISMQISQLELEAEYSSHTALSVPNVTKANSAIAEDWVRQKRKHLFRLRGPESREVFQLFSY